MKKKFLLLAGALFVFGINSDALARSKNKVPVKPPVSYHASGIKGAIQFVTGRHHRRHSPGHYRPHRHGQHFRYGYRGHLHGYNKHYYGNRDLYRYYKPYGNYYGNRHFYRGRRYNERRNHGHHNRHGRGPGHSNQHPQKRRH